MLDPARLDDFAQRLQRHPRVKIPQSTFWKYFAAAFPTRPPGEERAWLLRALQDLEARGVIELPSPKGALWDRSLRPPTPKSIRLRPAAKPPRDKAWKTHPWHPALSWIVDLTSLPADHESFLQRLNEALINGALNERAPLKYRSLQLCKHEKSLSSLASTSLFGEGRLTWDMLNVETEILPLAWHAIRPEGGRVLVVENAALFHVARVVLSESNDPPYDIIGFGGGNGIIQSIPYLAIIGRRLESIDYCGDLDREGIHIAQAAAGSARAAGLPIVRPATALHRLMLAQRELFNYPEGWKDEAQERRVTTSLSALSWLDSTLRTEVEAMLRSGKRVPEEVLGPRELSTLWNRAPKPPD